MTLWLAALALATSTASPAPFDLVCDGAVTRISKTSPPAARSGHFSMRLRIDPRTVTACVDECATVKTLGSLTRDNLILEIVDQKAGKIWRSTSIFVDLGRTSMDVHVLEPGVGSSNARAICRRAAFSGFPAAPR